MEISTGFRTAVLAAWGDPLLVAREGVKELYIQKDNLSRPLEQADLLDLAAQIGILAESSQFASPQLFFMSFVAALHNKAAEPHQRSKK